MDFSTCDATLQFCERVRSGVQTHLNPLIPDDERAPLDAPDIWRCCADLGLSSLPIPEELGGAGLGASASAHAMQAFGETCRDMGVVFSVAAHLFACVMPAYEFGSEHVHERFVRRLCSGELIGANAITEPEAGSDAYALEARAVRQGDDFLLSGTKSYVTNGPIADVFVVYAQTNPADGFLGITAFLVERGSPGLELGEAIPKIGLQSTPACPIILRDCRVPGAQVLGPVGSGARVFEASMTWERTCLFAAYLGLMDRQLAQTVQYAARRRQFGKPIGRNQAVSHKIANMKMRLEAARLLLHRACWKLEHGQASPMDIALAKLAVSEGAIASGLDSMLIHAGAGNAANPDIERMLRDAIPSATFSGTSEIQRDFIARELGL